MSVRDNQDLLIRHAPILRYDQRELFFPTPVDPYVESSSLWLDDRRVGEVGDVRMSDLTGQLSIGTYLQFVSDTERRAVVRTDARQLARRLLGPRLGRVGLFGRMVDALFLASVWFRPTTPGLTTPAAAIKSAELETGPRPVVYGRVAEVANWTVLHYAYFYTMNDWRSGYRGLNDHEADWEQIWIMCDPADGRPVWVVASNHELDGAHLRRHWDDDELQRRGERPVLFVGAGSHAFFFLPGDYVTRIDVPGLRWLLRLQRWVRRALQIPDQAAERGLGPAVGVPFVDSAPGDGIEHGEWDLRLLDESLPWVGQYRGLWGLDTGDRTNGERGPAGPKFTRTGDVRASWADPVGFAGLHGTNPPSMARAAASEERIRLALVEVNNEIERSSRLLPIFGQVDDPVRRYEASERLSDLLRRRVELTDLQARLRRGETKPAGIRDHLVQPAVPLAPPQEAGWLLAGWAAVSVPLLILAFASMLVFDPLRVTTVVAVVAAGFSLLEQLVRRHFAPALRLTAVYAVVVAAFLALRAVASGVLSVSVYVVGALLTAAAGVLFVANLGELTAVRRRADKAEAVTAEMDDRQGEADLIEES